MILGMMGVMVVVKKGNHLEYWGFKTKTVWKENFLIPGHEVGKITSWGKAVPRSNQLKLGYSFVVSWITAVSASSF